jgi:preprotein translocase subunit SecD
MKKNIRWRVITIIAVVLMFGGVGVYPIVAGQLGWPMPGWLSDKQLRLGLDLKGGVHLVLRVETDDALRIETETQAERLREALRTAAIPVSRRSSAASTSLAWPSRRLRCRGQPAIRFWSSSPACLMWSAPSRSSSRPAFSS